MSWALVVCYLVATVVLRLFLHGIMPGNVYVNDMQLVLTILSLTVASVGALWAVRN